MSVIITIDGDGLSLKKEISMQKAGHIITFLGLEEGTPISNAAPESPSPVELPRLGGQVTSSPRELLTEANAKTNAQKITVLINYKETQDQHEGVLSKEILMMLRKMGEEPGNFKRDVRTAEALKYIYSIPGKKDMYGATDTGRIAISKQFADEVTAKPKSRGGVFRKAIPPREEVTSLSLSTSLEGYPPFGNLPTKGDCILWILAYADSKGIESLTAREVEHISDKLRIKIAQNVFSGHNKKNMKENYVSWTDGKFKLQMKGMDHLKALLTENVEKE